jgi:hypothetical protein
MIPIDPEEDELDRIADMHRDCGCMGDDALECSCAEDCPLCHELRQIRARGRARGLAYKGDKQRCPRCGGTDFTRDGNVERCATCDL